MTEAAVLVRVMDGAAGRVLSGTERAYEVAIETCGELIYLPEGDASTSSWSAYVLWAELTDIVDMLGSEELCDELAVEFSRTWLALANRDDESVQRDFWITCDVILSERVLAYRDALPS